MPKFRYQEIGDEGVAFVQQMGSRNVGRYFRAVDTLISYTPFTVGEILQHLDANGIGQGATYKGDGVPPAVHGRHLHSYDPDTYTGSAALRAALEEYGDQREAELAAKAARRKRGRA